MTIKKHVKTHKAVYISSSIALVGGIVVGLVSGRNTVVKSTAVQILAWKSTQTIEVFVEALGDPGNVIQDVATGTIYASQGQAAKELGLSASAISKHLHGITPHVKGHTFKFLGKAAVPA